MCIPWQDQKQRIEELKAHQTKVQQRAKDQQEAEGAVCAKFGCATHLTPRQQLFGKYCPSHSGTESRKY